MKLSIRLHHSAEKAICIFQNRVDKVVLFIMPLLITIINSNWIFTPATNSLPDPWFYFAYFRYFPQYAPAYPSNIHYFVERLTWNVPGYYIYKFFPPLIANYILHLTVYYVSVFSLYGILNLLFGKRAAFIGALLMGGYPWFLRAVGWDYTDGAGIAHLLLLIFLLTSVFHVKHWKTAFFLAGIIHTSLLITNFFWIGFFPSWGGYFFLLNHIKKRFSVKQLLHAAFYFLLGSSAILVVCGIFYYRVTGSYFFLENSIKTSIELATDNQLNNDMVAVNYKSYSPYWHALPLIVVMVSTLLIPILIHKKDKNLPTIICVYLMFILSYSWLIFWNYYGNPVLIMFPYTSFGIPATFILLGGFIAGPVNQVDRKQFLAICILTIGVLVVPALVLNEFPAIEKLQGNILLILFFAIALPILLVISTKESRFIITGMIFLGILFYLTSKNSYVYIANRFEGRDNFNAIVSASNEIDAYYHGYEYKDFRLWFRADHYHNTFFSLAAVYLYPWGNTMDGPGSSRKPSNKLSIKTWDQIQDGDKIVILSSNSNVTDLLQEANKALSERNAGISLESYRYIHEGEFRFFLYFTKVKTLVETIPN